jgi:LuxR family maltose regulon positive regulatory protein
MGAIVFLCVILYVLLIGFYRYRKLEDGRQKKLALKVLILLAIFLPALIHDIIPAFQSSIRFFPILYCGFSLIFAHHLLTYYPQHHQTSTTATSQTPAPAFSEEALFARYDISPREQEIVSLLLQGYSNQKIADTLCIALSTVKTHLRNIYPKFGIKSRYELLTLFKNGGELPSHSAHTHDV